MPTQKITFTTKSINKENNGVDTNVRILPLNFTADGSNIEIVRIYFIMHDENQRQKLDILEEQKTYELSFSDGEVKVNKKDPNLSSKESGGHFASASSAGGASGPEPEKKGPFVLVNEGKKEIRVLCYPEFQLQITKQEAANTNSQDSENTAEEKAKSQSTNNTSNTNQTNTGNNGGNSKKKSGGNTADDNSSSNQNTNETPPPAPEQPTQEEINNSKEKLEQAKQGGNKDELSEAIKKDEELKDKGVKSSENEEANKSAREELAKNKEDYRKTIFEATQKKLTNNGVNKDELGTEAKTKFQKLENGEITEKSAVDEAEREIVKEVYEKAATKKYSDLESRVNQALKGGKDKKKLEALKRELSQFINNSNYQAKKSSAEALMKKVEVTLQNNTSDGSKGEFP